MRCSRIVLCTASLLVLAGALAQQPSRAQQGGSKPPPKKITVHVGTVTKTRDRGKH